MYVMPKLIIDNIPVEVQSGTTVLEAARAVGIVIPHFCYHPALGSVGFSRGLLEQGIGLGIGEAGVVGAALVLLRRDHP